MNAYDTAEQIAAQIEAHRTERARQLAALRVPGDLPLTAAKVLHYLTPRGAGPQVLAEVARRRELGMDPIEAQRSVAADLHNVRWKPAPRFGPTGRLEDMADPVTCTHGVADMGDERLGYWTCVACGLVYPVPYDGPDEPTEPPGL